MSISGLTEFAILKKKWLLQECNNHFVMAFKRLAARFCCKTQLHFGYQAGQQVQGYKNIIGQTEYKKHETPLREGFLQRGLYSICSLRR